MLSPTALLTSPDDFRAARAANPWSCTIMRKARKMAAFRNRVELSVTPLECRRLLSISASYIGQAPLNEGGALHDTVSFTTGLVSDGIADYCITVTGLANKTIQY